MALYSDKKIMTISLSSNTWQPYTTWDYLTPHVETNSGVSKDEITTVYSIEPLHQI